MTGLMRIVLSDVLLGLRGAGGVSLRAPLVLGPWLAACRLPWPFFMLSAGFVDPLLLHRREIEGLPV
ncbi:MAG: hypothetical protein M0Z53_14625 [Thermaerobacter sp.]|nr:hypothetical protein [Thermaerobacter sp.]